MMKLAAVIRDAKLALRACGFEGKTLAELVAQIGPRLLLLEGERAEVKEVLREHGAQPNGKRLADAVDEALRLAKRGFESR